MQETPESTRQRSNRWRVVTGVLVVTLVLAACSDDSDDDRVGATVPPGSAPQEAADQDETDDNDEPEDAPDNAARQYFDLLATGELSRMGGMLELAPENSPAQLYAIHQIALVRADPFRDGIAATNEWHNGSVEQCSEAIDASGDIVEECFTFADFELADGLLASFTVDELPIAERISAGEAVEADGVSARVVTAYEAARGDLFLNVDVTNNREEPVSLAEYGWVYTTADGRQVEPADFGLASDIGPGATAATTVTYLQTPIGGTLRFVAFADDFLTEIRFELPVPAGG